MKTVIGDVFGDWQVIGGPHINKRIQKREFLCRCKCGTERLVRDNNLKNGTSKNCGCARILGVVKRNKERVGGVWVNDDSRKLAQTWDRMIRRCYDPSAKGFHNYGGRGITVCERWRGRFGLMNFINDMGPIPKGKSLGRKINNDSYSPSNCRWETVDEQQSNKRTNVYGFYNGLRMTAAQIGRIVGRHSSSIAKDIRKGLYANNSDLS